MEESQSGKGWKWREAKYAACRSASKATTLRASPPWIELSPYKELIEDIYMKAALMTVATGVEHHVDHIHPLRGGGKILCGLHVPANLQVLSQDSGRKYNGLPREILEWSQGIEDAYPEFEEEDDDTEMSPEEIEEFVKETIAAAMAGRL